MTDTRSASMKKRWEDPEYKKRLSKKMKEAWLNPVYREKMHKIRKTQNSSLEAKRKISERSKKMWSNPDKKAQISEAIKRKWADPKYRERLSEAHKRRWKDPAFKERVSAAIEKALNVPDVKRRRSESMKRVCANPEYREKLVKRLLEFSRSLKGRKIKSDAAKNLWARPGYKEKVGKKVFGRLTNKHPGWGKGYHHSELAKKKISQGRTSFCQNPEVKRRMSEQSKKRWSDPDYKEKVVKKVSIALHARPNKAEKKLEDILCKILPNEYKYTGDGSFIINGKCPDFTNVNGQKKVIEFYGDYWHRNDNPQDRIDIFKKFGFDCLVVWEHELKNEFSLTQALLKFNGGI